MSRDMPVADGRVRAFAPIPALQRIAGFERLFVHEVRVETGSMARIPNHIHLAKPAKLILVIQHQWLIMVPSRAANTILITVMQWQIIVRHQMRR